MKNNVLILSNSNFFTVLSHLSLHRHFNHRMLNVRYANEEMDRQDHLTNQIQEFYHDLYYQKGFIKDRYSFSFNEQLIRRVTKQIQVDPPEIILFEMKSFDDNEWKLLHFLHAHFSIPVVVFIPNVKKSKDLMFKLAENGVREVITKFDETIFMNAFLRNI